MNAYHRLHSGEWRHCLPPLEITFELHIENQISSLFTALIAGVSEEWQNAVVGIINIFFFIGWMIVVEYNNESKPEWISFVQSRQTFKRKWKICLGIKWQFYAKQMHINEDNNEINHFKLNTSMIWTWNVKQLFHNTMNGDLLKWHTAAADAPNIFRMIINYCYLWIVQHQTNEKKKKEK